MVYQEAVDAGNQAFADEDFDEAIKQYSSALVAKPGDVNALLLRANAYMKCDRAQDAVADCDAVLQYEPANQKALFRKGTAQLMLSDYLSSYRSFKKMASEQGKRWARKSIALMDKKDLVHVADEDAKCVFMATLTKAEFKEHDKLPTPELPCATNEAAQHRDAPCTSKECASPTSTEQAKKQEAAAQLPLPREKKDPFRVDWYQNVRTVTIDVFIKGLAQNAVSAEVDGRDLSIEISLGDGKEYNKNITLLKRASVKSVRVMPSKASIELAKAEDGQWSSLEAKAVKEPTVQNSSMTSAQAQAQGQIDPHNPRHEKDWDKIIKSAVKEITPDDEKDSDFYDDDIDAPDPTTRFFRQVYKNATDDQRRAMMKSFQESGGTVLNGNWNEVCNGRVEPADRDHIKEKAGER